jgi:hypothetical protein
VIPERKKNFFDQKQRKIPTKKKQNSVKNHVKSLPKKMDPLKTLIHYIIPVGDYKKFLKLLFLDEQEKKLKTSN